MDNQQAAINVGPAGSSKAPKSPPLAFQTTSNDSLVAPMYSSSSLHMAPFPSQPAYSPGTQQKLDYHLDDPMHQELQAQIQKQAEALRLQHQAFVVERECWDLERNRLYRRVSALEGLLKAASGHSPAKSPITSPFSGLVPTQPMQPQPQSFTSSMARNSSMSTGSRLPSIVEDESPMHSPKAERSTSSISRHAAPTHIELPGGHQIPTIDGHVEVSASALPSTGPEVPFTPPATRNVFSPPPPEYRTNAGHTPLKVPARPLSMHSPARSTFSEPNTDTPTRTNTESNANLVHEGDEDEALKGPLHMPELPNTPGDENFTIDMLTARLKDIEEHPEENEPFALHARCNRRESVPDIDVRSDIPQLTSDGLSTITEEDRIDSTTSGPSPNVAIEAKSNDEQEVDRGIKLKKKASCNFGTPFGQLGPMRF